MKFCNDLRIIYGVMAGNARIDLENDISKESGG
jgi:sRNA-binding protein